ncbi:MULTISPECIES: helix-turn-helix domain-containing protein [Paenibacillus]|uniref:SOS-response transcriptional repressor LexA n=1 Tax=Paenibacillus peoriae TaxID=59893 RepID=A0ABU1Q9E0_9BACL|nr:MULTISPECIES: XRE family transcriptional regulator [Paenibacillus]MDR6776251.1 SOS-response transcriptional repressor LexA [Paenibacillus peoriae]
MNIGEKVKEQRKLMGLTQPQLAEKIEMSIDSIKKLETNRMNPSIDTLNKLIKFFKVKADYFLDNLEKESEIVDNKMVKVGIIQKVNAGEDATYGEFKSYVMVDSKILEGRPAIALKLKDNSMDKDNLFTGDIVVAKQMTETEKIKSTDIYLILSNDGFYVRRIKKHRKFLILTPSNPDYSVIEINKNPYLKNKYHIFGKIVQIIRNI